MTTLTPATTPAAERDPGPAPIPTTAAPDSRRRFLLILLALLLGALLVRGLGLGWGIPHYDPVTLAHFPLRVTAHQDEDVFLSGLLHMHPSAGNFDTDDYHWGTLQFYLIYGDLLLGEAFGAIPAPWEAAFAGGDIAALPRIYILGRLVSVTAGTLGVLLVALLGQALAGGNRRAGLAAGVGYAFAPLAVVGAHYLTNDVTMSVLLVGAVLAAVQAARRQDSRALALAGLLLGLATTAKYSAAFAAPGLLIAATGLWWTARRRERFLPRTGTYLLLPALMVGCGFLLGEPYALLVPDKLRRDLDWVAGANAVRPGYGMNQILPVLRQQMEYLARLGLTWPLALLAGAGVAILVLRVLGPPGDPGAVRPPGARLAAAVMLGAVGGTVLGVGANALTMIRYTQPLIPLLCATAGLAWAAIPWRAPRLAAGVLAAGVAAWITLGQLALLTGPHPLNALSAWLAAHLRPGQTVAQPWIKEPVIDPVRFHVVQISPWIPALAPAVAPDYVLIPNDMMNPPTAALRKRLAREYRVVARFGAQPEVLGYRWDEGDTPHDWKYSHPQVIVYARR